MPPKASASGLPPQPQLQGIPEDETTSLLTPFKKLDMEVIAKTPSLPAAPSRRKLNILTGGKVATEWTTALSDRSDKTSQFKKLLHRVPGLQRVFEPEFGLPLIQLSVEIESVQKVDIADQTVTLRYGVNLDWFDVLSELEYAKSTQDKEYYKEGSYWYQPTFKLQHVIEDKVELEAGRDGVRFDSRFKLQACDGTAFGLRWEKVDGAFDGAVDLTAQVQPLVEVLKGELDKLSSEQRGKRELTLSLKADKFESLKLGIVLAPTQKDKNVPIFQTKHTVVVHGMTFRAAEAQLNLVHLKRTGKGHATVKQRFSLTEFPLDHHTLMLEFEPGKIKTNVKFCEIVNARRVGRKISNSTAPSLLYPYTLEPIRIKALKTFESYTCETSKVVISNTTFPFMAHTAADVHDFRFDTNLQDDVRPDLYTVRANFYRVSNSFVLQNLVPVLIIVIASALVDGIPAEELSNRLTYLVTLFLALYAHKYTMVQQLNTMQTTTIEYIMLLGFFCLLGQCLVAFLAGPLPQLDGQAVLPEQYTWLLSLAFVLLMLSSLCVYYVNARSYFAKIHTLNTNNRTWVYRWLFASLSEPTRNAVHSVGTYYHTLVTRITELEKKAVSACFSELLGLTYADLSDETPGLSWSDLGSLQPVNGHELVDKAGERKIHRLAAELLTGKQTFTPSEWAAIGIRDLRMTDYVAVRSSNRGGGSGGSSDSVDTNGDDGGKDGVRYFRPSGETIFDELIAHTPQQEQETVTLLNAKLSELPPQLVECFRRSMQYKTAFTDESDRSAVHGASSMVHVKRELECVVKRDIRGKVVNDKYRTTFVYSADQGVEKQVVPLLQLLSEASTGMPLFAVDTNVHNASRPSMIKLYVGVDVGWTDRRCPLEISILSEETLELLEDGHMHRVYRLLRMQEVLSKHHKAAEEEATFKRLTDGGLVTAGVPLIGLESNHDGRSHNDRFLALKKKLRTVMQIDNKGKLLKKDVTGYGSWCWGSAPAIKEYKANGKAMPRYDL